METIKVLFKTFPVGHLVSDREFERLKIGFAKMNMELLREGTNYDLLMVKGFSHEWKDLPKDKPIIYYSIGAEYKLNEDLEKLNAPIKELYQNANAVVHISDFCMEEHHIFFNTIKEKEEVIIPACEPNLPKEYPPRRERLKLATTCIPRPVKRCEQTEELCKKYNIELVTAYGGVSDFSYYHNCDGYIHLSRKEGMPNTVLEALSYGLPCIVTNYGGAKEAVGDAGIIIKNDPENNDPENMPWNPQNIESIDEFLFANAIQEFKERLPELRIKVRERVLTKLNDYICAYLFRKHIFEELL